MTIKAIHGRQTYLCFHEISVYGDGTFMVSLVSLLHVLHGWMGKGRSTEEIQMGMNWKLLCTMARGTRRSFWALIPLNSAKNQLLVHYTNLLKVRITEGDPNLLHDGSWGTFSLFATMAYTAMMSSSSSLTGTTNATKLEQGVVGCHCKATALFLFSALGFPLAITYSLACNKFDCCCCWTT